MLAFTRGFFLIALTFPLMLPLLLLLKGGGRRRVSLATWHAACCRNSEQDVAIGGAGQHLGAMTHGASSTGRAATPGDEGGGSPTAFPLFGPLPEEAGDLECL
jgi:hypothetical protein